MSGPINYPAPGCVVEYLESNAVQIAIVLEESGGKLRLLLPSRRETKLAQGRILPWAGPAYPQTLGREEYVRILEQHRNVREEKAASIDTAEVWELAQGEISQAPASWFAELFETDPDADTIAAYGHALLASKTRFRFQAPDFQVYDAELVEKRQEEQKARAEREALVAGGAAFLKSLWERAQKKSAYADTALVNPPDDSIAARIERLLQARMLNPESQEDEALWHLISRGLPEVPHLAYQLLVAWGKLPPHYNFWLDRAEYEPGDSWWSEFAGEVGQLEAQARRVATDATNTCELPFISIDGPTTRDIDDAFHIEKKGDGWLLTVALACPALNWPFGSPLDRKIQRRATSIYLPEGHMHMLPEVLGTDACSLIAGEHRPSFCLRIEIDAAGNALSCEPFASNVKLAANLNYEDVQKVLDAAKEGKTPDNPAAGYVTQLAAAHAFALKREQRRIADGAIIMRRPEAQILLEGSGAETRVDIVPEPPAEDAQRLVSEMMVLASASLADWSMQKGIPLLHRTQNVTVPKEYSGIWSRPEDLARIMRSLVPSVLEITPRPHTALGLARYAPVTSPLRRYADLINEAQILNYLEDGRPRWTATELEVLLENLQPSLDAAAHAQKFRPRYWKLLYFKQAGDKKWWPAVITEENDNFVSASLPEQGIFVRGKRQMFDERACPGTHVRLRLGKINPLCNEIFILEAAPEE